MNHAFLILAHKNPTQLNMMISALQAENRRFFVHVDYKSHGMMRYLQSMIECPDNVKICDRQISVKWGVLQDDGSIQWKPGRLERRIGKATFENQRCLNCKMLPVCMGPCSQKQIDVGADRLDDVCMLNALEMQMDEYIEFTFNNMATTQNLEKTPQ